MQFFVMAHKPFFLTISILFYLFKATTYTLSSDLYTVFVEKRTIFLFLKPPGKTIRQKMFYQKSLLFFLPWLLSKVFTLLQNTKKNIQMLLFHTAALQHHIH